MNHKPKLTWIGKDKRPRLEPRILSGGKPQPADMLQSLPRRRRGVPQPDPEKNPPGGVSKCEWDHDDYSFSLNVLEEDGDV